MPPAEHEVVFAAFFPPCTDLAVSGARWFRDKGIGKLYRSIGLFYRSAQLAELFKCPYIIENPVSAISSYWRKPDYTFHPSHYGNRYLKKTCLWVGGGFVMPSRTPVRATQGMKLYWLPPSHERANLRSVTPSGFARAVFKANDPEIEGRRRRKWQRQIKARWGDRCALTGIANPMLSSAAHIRREDSDVLDGRYVNGIPLAPHIRRLFDTGLLGFDNKGRVLLSNNLSAEDRASFVIPRSLRRPPTPTERQLFHDHRAQVFGQH